MSDLVKALRCLASQTACPRSCHRDKYNFMNKGKPRMVCAAGVKETVQCPYYQETYGTAFDDEECSGFLGEAADIIEELEGSHAEKKENA